jgi:hypothetical protein
VLGLTTLVWLDEVFDEDESSDEDESDDDESEEDVVVDDVEEVEDAEVVDLYVVVPHTTTVAIPASPRLAMVTVAVRLAAIRRPLVLISMVCPVLRLRCVCCAVVLQDLLFGIFL